MEAVRDAVPRAMDKRIDLGYDGAEPGAPGVRLAGQPDAAQGDDPQPAGQRHQLHAVQRRQQPGVITARVLADPFGRRAGAAGGGHRAPASPRRERELVFQPFYRALGTNVDGSGLGLPIVLEIARQHGAEIALEDAHPGQMPPGTRVDGALRAPRRRAAARGSEAAQAAL